MMDRRALGERANRIFPFAIAVILPPAGLFLALAARQEGNRDLAQRLLVVSLLAAVVWALVFLA
jgi:hypothetical protein